MWGRHSYRWSDLDFEAQNEGIAVDWPFVIRISRRGRVRTISVSLRSFGLVICQIVYSNYDGLNWSNM